MAQAFNRKAGRARHHIGVLRRAEGRDDPEDRQDESKVADAICYKSFARRARRFLAIELVADQ